MKKIKSFALVELVLVIVVASIAIPGIMYLFNQLARKSINDEAMYTATMLAEGELERVIQQSFANVADQNRNSPVSFGGNFSGYSWQIRVDAVPAAVASDPGMAQYKQVEARVTSNIIGDVSLKTVVTK
jgi:type II secretory pathway pseudopilin PulG